jgi:hypothetical protein
VFLCVRAPLGPVSAGVVSQIVRAACTRAGLNESVPTGCGIPPRPGCCGQGRLCCQRHVKTDPGVATEF